MNDERTELKSSNYLDNDSNTGWSWQVDGDKALIITKHDHPKEHEHRLDVTDIPVGEIVDHPDYIIGKAHRVSAHYYADGTVKKSKNSKGKELTDMSSSKAHQAFAESLNPKNYGNENAPTDHGIKSASQEKSGEGGRERGDEGPGREGRAPEFKGKENTNISNMRAFMKTGSEGRGITSQQGKGSKGIDGAGKTAVSVMSGNAHAGESGGGIGGHGGTSGGGHGIGGGNNGAGHNGGSHGH